MLFEAVLFLLVSDMGLLNLKSFIFIYITYQTLYEISELHICVHWVFVVYADLASNYSLSCVGYSLL